MTGPDPQLDPVIHAPVRPRVMVTLAALSSRDSLSFSRLQQLLGLTAGNLITHLITHLRKQYTAALRQLLD